MSKKSGIDFNQIILLGAFAAGGYLLYTFFKNNPIGQAAGAVGNAITNAGSAVQQAANTITTPSPITGISPIAAINPVSAVIQASQKIATLPGGIDVLASLNPIAAVINATQRLFAGSPKTAAAATPKIIGPQTSTRLQPLTMIPAPAGAKAQIPSLALSQKLRSLA